MAAKTPVNILLVDDQPAKLLSYETILADLGETLVRANSANEALEQLLRRDFAVVLVDVCMPDLNGFELASLIRGHPRYQNTAVIMVSGVMVEDIDRLRGYDSGAVDYVSVPIVPAILRAKVAVFAELYRTTTALARLNLELEQRVGERTAEIEEARREAENANRLKDEFLATLSHELRTPLNAITGWTHLLRHGGLTTEERGSAIETIERNALLQSQLIADLLDVSRIASGKLRLDCRRLELTAVAAAAAASLRPQAEAKSVRLETDLGEEASVRADPARLQQVFTNLLSNAIKFARENGRVRLCIRAEEAEAVITVEDDGPGIVPEFLPYIFDRFRQADPTSTRAQKGLGLGLTIVRHLVELHGGRVAASNRLPGPGAVFSVILPLALGKPDAVDGALPAPPLSSRTLANVRVLVVDDEADGREVAARLLEGYGAHSLVAASAEEAFHLLQREAPDVLVADIEMPGEDGYQLLHRVRSLPPDGGGETPAVALTAYVGAQDRERLLEAGFQRHVPKPVVAAQLVAAVSALAHRVEVFKASAT